MSLFDNDGNFLAPSIARVAQELPALAGFLPTAPTRPYGTVAASRPSTIVDPVAAKPNIRTATTKSQRFST